MVLGLKDGSLSPMTSKAVYEAVLNANTPVPGADPPEKRRTNWVELLKSDADPLPVPKRR
jgi:hypothetical protein